MTVSGQLPHHAPPWDLVVPSVEEKGLQTLHVVDSDNVHLVVPSPRDCIQLGLIDDLVGEMFWLEQVVKV